MSTNILTLDEIIENPTLLDNAEGETTPVRKTKSATKPVVKKSPKKNLIETSDFDGEKERKEKEKINGLGINKLASDAKEKLDYYLKRTPQFNVIKEKLDILGKAVLVYSKNNQPEMVTQTKQIMAELTQEKQKFVRAFNSKENSKDKVDTKELKSGELDLLKKRKDELQKDLKQNSPSHIATRVREYRDQINIKSKMKANLQNTVVDFDDIVDNIDENAIGIMKSSDKLSQLEQDYFDLIGFVCDKIDYSFDEVLKMSHSKILSELKLVEDKDELEMKREELERLNVEIRAEIDNLSGVKNINNIMFEIFDFANDEEGTIPKEILAASSVGMVQAYAYVIANKYGKIQHLDDAIGYGMLGLTTALNAWYEKQKMIDSPLTFKGFANQYISGAIKRGLLEIQGSGRASGSSMATIESHTKKRMENFLKYNPEFKDVDQKIVRDMVNSYSDEGGAKAGGFDTVSESDFSAMVGGDDIDGDIWANATADMKNNLDDLIDAKSEYERMMKSVYKLLNLFEVKEDKKNGFRSVTDRKLFNMYDRKLFMMYFGLEHKKDSDQNNTAKNNYTYEEMAEELMAMYRKNGNTKLTLTPAALSGKQGRIAVLLKKIKFAIEENPDLKLAFEYINDYWATNSEALNYMSNKREELSLKNDNQRSGNLQANQYQLNKQAENGKRLMDVFQLSEDNLMDSEIAQYFKGI